jgi:hypothetical protein
MVRTCREHNVAIMVDFIINHLASSFPTPDTVDAFPFKMGDVGIKQCGVNIACESYNGAKYGSRSYSCQEWNSSSDKCDIQPSSFHHTIGDDSKPACTFDMQSMQINLLTGVELCDPGFGADLNTEDLHTVRLLQDYLLRLTDAGVTMLRIDAATLVAASSQGAIIEPFPWEFNTAEVLGWSRSPSVAKMMDVYERFKMTTLYDFSYGTMIGASLYDQAGGIPKTFVDLPDYRPRGPYNRDVATDGWFNDMIPQSENVLVYIDNHDGMSGALNYHTAQLYGQAVLFMLAHPFGAAAQIMSSFYYANNGAASTVQTPPLAPMTPDEIERSRTDYRVNLTRKVDGAAGKCRISPRDMADPDWLNGKCEESDSTGCNWICQHRWTGVAGLTHVRKSIAKDVTMKRIWKDASNGGFAFSIGSIAWVFMKPYITPKGNLKDLLQSPQTTGLPQGEYCNLAQLPSKYAGSLSQWPDSDGQKYCADSKNEMIIQLDASGFVTDGVAPAGKLNGMVVIHKDFPVQSTMVFA